MVGLGKLAADPDILVWADRMGLVFWDWFSGTGFLGLVFWDWFSGTGFLGLVFWDWFSGTGFLGLVFWDWFSGTGSSCPYLDGCGV